MTICVAHLVRRGNPPDALSTFLRSYQAHTPGADHQLVLILKGLTRADLQGAADGYEAMTISDSGYDLTSYAAFARLRVADRYCFLNSYSRVLCDDWLGHLSAALDEPGVGLAGASGSWASQLDYLLYQSGLPSAYRAVFDDREATRQAFLEVAREGDPAIRDRGPRAARLLAAATLLRQMRGFSRFPAPHLRTNGFITNRNVLLTLFSEPVHRKLDAYRAENGRASITARLLSGGRRVVVVGRDGSRLDPEQWPESETFWQGNQENLLIADNRTDDYARGGPERRLLLARLAWGRRAAPA